MVSDRHRAGTALMSRCDTTSSLVETSSALSPAQPRTASGTARDLSFTPHSSLTQQARQGTTQKTGEVVVCLQSLFAEQRHHEPWGKASKQ